MAIVSDNELDHEIQKMKALLERVKQSQVIFGNTFQTLPIKERAKVIKQIQTDHRILSAFVEKSQRENIPNSGTRFAVENLKQSFQTLLTLWRKVEKNIESFIAAGGAAIAPSANAFRGASPSEPEVALKKYAEALSSLGHTPTQEMLVEFKQKLEVAYEKAKVQSGGKDLTINIVRDGSKIKVRMEPK